MVEPLIPNHPKNTDVECLRCGAMNIPENHICGKCGASLPLVYDEEGKVFSWRDNAHFAELLSQGPQRKMSPMAIGWLLRLGLILFAILMALVILTRRR
ncbi:MAG TPA: hypothetical protein VMV05_03160 [bacterium]|nr:hypothetical protein [bacterium]